MTHGHGHWSFYVEQILGTQEIRDLLYQIKLSYYTLSGIATHVCKALLK